MRTTHRRQLSLPVPSVPHKHARMLASDGRDSDAMPELEEQVLSDLTSDGVGPTFGRDGLSAMQVYASWFCTHAAHYFEQLSFILAGLDVPRLLSARPPRPLLPKRASIAGNLSKLRPQTLQALTSSAMPSSTVGDGNQPVRTDTTSVAAPSRSARFRAPFDSVRAATTARNALKWDSHSDAESPARVSHRTTALRTPVSKEDRRVSVLRPHR